MELLRLLALSVLILLVALWLQSLCEASQALDTAGSDQARLKPVLVDLRPVLRSFLLSSVMSPLAPSTLLKTGDVESHPFHSRPRPIMD